MFHSRGRTYVGVLWALGLALAIHTGARAQVGQNINVITGSDSQFTGDMFRQRQNESVGGISSVNTSHMMVAYNDYRTVDFTEDAGAVVPPSLINATFQKLLRILSWPVRMARGRTVGLQRSEPEGADGEASAQAFIGLSFSDNAGKDWYTGLHPGHRSLPPAAGAESWDQSEMLRAYDAASDPVMATTDRQFFVGGIAFNPGGGGVGFVSRFTDRNNSETDANIHFDGTRILLTQTTSRFFVDKPSIAAALGPKGATYVYAAFVVFDQSDPLTSKIHLFRSTDGGMSWGPGAVVSEPLSRNQAPWIVIDPNDARTMYIGWRVFSARTGGLANAIVGKKSTNGGASFTTSLPYPVALLLKPFDQPQGDIRAGSLPIPRSNSYPTATIDGNGVIHVALQEYVYPANHPVSLLRGLPLLPGVKVSVGVPRITVTSSTNGGASWSLRSAIDLANGAGTQFMPVIISVGEPGRSCSGNAGEPRSRVMVMYYDARSGGVGVTAGGNGYVAGGNRQFDVRIAEASACNNDGLGRLVFGASQQMSRYSLSSRPPHGIVQTPGYGFTAVNRAYGIFCGGYCAFSGDYIHLTPRQPYVQTLTGWKQTTARGVDQNTLPAPVVQGFWADTRNVILPTEPAPPLPPSNPGFIDSLPFSNYQSPGSGKPPTACFNAGSRDQNIYSAEYSPGNLFAGAPITFRQDNIPHAYPLFVENRAGVQRFFRLTIGSAQASFDYRSFDRTLPTPPPPDLQADIAIGPYSSVTGSVVVDAGATGPIDVTVQELASTVVNGVVTSNGALLAGGAKTTVLLVTGGESEPTPTETHRPVVAPTPIVTFPFAGQVNPQNPVTMTPFTQQPFTQQTGIMNPFTQQPFTQQTTVHDVIDFTFPVTLAGDQAAAASALLAVQNAQQLTGSYLFQVIISRVALTPATNGCSSIDTVHELQVSNIRAPFTQQPFTQQPFTQQPFTQQPFTQQPFTQQPFTQQPFSQQSDPRDPVVSTSTFYLAPSPTPGQTAGLRAADRVLARSSDARLTPVRLQATPGPNDYRADRSDLGLTYTLRAFQTVADPPVKIIDPVTGQANVGVFVVTDTPEIVLINGVPRFSPAGRLVSGGGGGVPVMLTVTQQPGTAGAGQTLAPISVAVQDGFGRTLTNLPPTQVTIALANNPGGATLSGELTANTVQGVATFSNLSVDQIGTGYTLRVSAANLPAEISAPFNIIAAANQLVFTVQPTSTPSALAIAPPIQVAIRDSGGNPTTSTAPVQLQILNNPGGGVLTGTTTIAAVNGVATFANLAITLPGEGYTLQATSPGLTPATSQPFDIMAAANNQLVFTVQPSSSVPGGTLSPPVQVAVVDGFGNLQTNSTAPIALSLTNGSAGATLSGTLVKNAVNGIATFDNLSINLAGVGYTLIATSGALQPATSNPFAIATVSGSLAIVTGALPEGTVGALYTQSIAAQGGVQPYIWDIQPIPGGPEFTLPDGLVLTGLPSGSATISGTPTTAQVRSFRLRVTDASGAQATRDLCIRIEQAASGVLSATPSTATAEQIAQLLVGAGQAITISNAVYRGAPGALGTFTGGASATGLTTGVILSSGTVANVNPPNNSPGISANHNLPGDPDLQTLVPDSVTVDAAVLEFDFTVTDPNATTVKFDYVFSSDEYNEFVNSPFNDVFGFFMSGPGFPKGNLALVPNTQIPVSINNVNGGNPFGTNATNPEQFINNDPSAGGGAIGTQADGLTRVFSMSAPIVPKVTYHLKIAIADAGDTSLDSWVLIKTGSFTVGCPIIPNCPTCGQHP